MKTNPNDCAFPADYKTQTTAGLTKREYFAGLAMQGILASSYYGSEWSTIVDKSVRVADLLIEELNKTNENKLK